MDVAVADHRLARLARPAPRRPIKVCLTGEHGVAFDGIKKMAVSIQIRPEAAARRKERMRSDNQAAAALLQAFKIGKCAHIFGSGRKIEQEHVLALDRPLDAGNQHHAALGGIGPQVGDVQLLVMQCDSERAVAKRGRDGEVALSTHLHRGDSFVPSLDDGALAERKLEGLSAVDRAVELGALRAVFPEPSRVVHHAGLTGFRRCGNATRLSASMHQAFRFRAGL